MSLLDYITEELYALDDDELAELARVPALHDLSEPAEGCLKGLLLPVFLEIARRRELEENARVAMEANGHEVYLELDEVARSKGDGGWSGYCSCHDRELGIYRESYEVAVAAAAEHAATHGGRWADGHPADPTAYEFAENAD